MLARSNSTLSTRSSAGGNRRKHDDVNAVMVRYDYSAIYLENDDLEEELEDKRHALQRGKYRASIAGEESLKEIKQNAEKLMSLKEKVNKREPHESTNKIDRLKAEFDKHDNVSLRKVPDSGIKNKKYSISVERQSENEKHNSDMDVNDVVVETVEDSNCTVNKTTPKLVNNLTMFALVFRNFKVSSTHASQTEQQKSQTDGEKNTNKTRKQISNMNGYQMSSLQRNKSSKTACDVQTNQILPGFAHQQSENTKTKVVRRKRRPATVPAYAIRRPIDRSSSIMMDFKTPVYGINVQKDFTRSRRKLEEMSKLEMDSKYKYENKYELRRQRLLAMCKNNKALDERIQKFLCDIDEFKKLDKPESQLDIVPMRSKSACIFRDIEKDL